MAYFFSDDDISRIKDIPFTEIFDALGISYRNKGNYIEFLCPFHNDRHFGSAKVNKIKNTCKCHACDEYYSPYDLIMKMENKSFHEAVIRLAEIKGELYKYEMSSKPAQAPPKYPLKKLTDDNKNILGFDISKYPVTFSICKEKLTWNWLFQEHPIEYRLIILNKVFETRHRLEKEIANTELFLRGYNGDYKWFYEETLKLKREKLKRIIKIGTEYGYDRVMKEISS